MDERGVCDACTMGSRHRLRYECRGCGGAQMIPHPMWRYQPSPAAFGDVSWACHVRCGDYTKWRVLPSDLPRVPLADAPESWGVRDEWLAGVRQGPVYAHNTTRHVFSLNLRFDSRREIRDFLLVVDDTTDELRRA